jgi:hypothetical protein
LAAFRDGRDSLNGFFVEIEIANRANCFYRPEDTLGFQVCDGGIVLVDGTEDHPSGRRSRSIGQYLAQRE